MKQLILIAHNIRSCHNVGSLFRTAEGLGVNKIWLTGYTPYPLILATDNAGKGKDERLPHQAKQVDSKIKKTSLGAENLIAWQHAENIIEIVNQFKRAGFVVSALEQHPKARELSSYKPAAKQVLIVGNEISGIDDSVLSLCANILFIPMKGKKESFNVVQAAAMALFYFTNK